jgi:alanine racemase
MNKIEVDLNAIAHNLSFFKKNIYPETKIIGVVKENAYGHGLVDAARVVWTSGADILAVERIEEAIDLRVAKVKAPILVLGYVEPGDYHKIVDFDFILSINDFEDAYRLSREARKRNLWSRVDLEIDTGMNRWGVSPFEFLQVYQRILDLEHIKLVGIHSHFADPLDKKFSKEQINVLQNALFTIQQSKSPIPMVHMASTDAILSNPESQFDAIRVGIGLFGYSATQTNGNLQPALEFKTTIAYLRRVGKGESVGYNRAFVAKQPKKIAVLPVGYADGYPRSLSGKSKVIIGGKKVPVVGDICMGTTMVDVTGIDCSIGDEAILIGRGGDDKVYADDLAELIGTIPYEILSRLPARVFREYHFK